MGAGARLQSRRRQEHCRHQHARRTGRRQYENPTGRSLAVSHSHARSAQAFRPRHRHPVLHDRRVLAVWRRGSDAAVLSHGDSLLGDAVVVHAINAENLSQKRLAGNWQWTLNLLHLWVWFRDCWMIRGLRYKIFVAVSARVSADLQRLYGVPLSRIASSPMKSTSNAFKPTRLQVGRSARSSGFPMTPS